MVTPKANWYVIYTHPKKERKIHSVLLKQNVETYLPVYKVTRKWSDRIKNLTSPLFPNYLFVHIPDQERVTVLKVAGVARFISFDGRPTIISDDEIHTIRRLENSPLELESNLVNGDRVQVVQGPFTGLEGVLFKKMGKQRFGVRLEGLRQALSLEICESLLKKL